MNVRRNLIRVLTFCTVIAGWTSFLRASDHADPLVLNPLKPPTINEPRITDLHVFLDSDQEGTAEAKALVLCLSVFPSLPPLDQKENDDVVLPDSLDLEGYRYTIHLDLGAEVGFGDEANLKRYGGTVLTPNDISSQISLGFELNNDTTIKSLNFSGLDPKQKVENGAFDTKAVNVATGVFDDPFIFPRFFRTNVVSMVVSIPLDRFNSRPETLLAWATTHKNGKQIDHVGRAQRTQLPRFDILNTLPPSDHVNEITRRHSDPTLMEDFRRTFLSPLFGHRPYDEQPDVAILSLSEDTAFPNGRRLADDVGAVLAESGETQIFETSYIEDPKYKRETENDKPFTNKFPYLAAPWTKAEVKENPPLPLPPATLVDGSWRILWLIESLAIVGLVLLLCWAVRGKACRIAIVLFGLIVLVLLWPVFTKNYSPQGMRMEAMMQPAKKLNRLLIGGAAIGLLGTTFLFSWGRKHERSRRKLVEDFPAGEQKVTKDDEEYAGTTYEAVHKEVIEKSYYSVWGAPNEKPLPVFPVTVLSLLKGLLTRPHTRFVDAQKRTLSTRADMRWGEDREGVRRLLHSNGICLSGEWSITESPKDAIYTGCFQPGTKAKIIARYSTCCTETRGGYYRSLSMVGKIFPNTTNPDELVFPASFFTQEDIGGTKTTSFREAELANSPPVSPWRRGKGILTFLLTAVTFLRSDKQPSERQLYQIGELGKPDDVRTSCPRFMRLTVADDTRKVAGDKLDFRDEILATMYDPGNPKPMRSLTFNIEVSDDGERYGRLVQRLRGQKWTKIGTIEFEQASVSHNGDYVIHFPHPPWRNDRNDPNSLACPDLKST